MWVERGSGQRPPRYATLAGPFPPTSAPKRERKGMVSGAAALTSFASLRGRGRGACHSARGVPTREGTRDTLPVPLPRAPLTSLHS